MRGARKRQRTEVDPASAGLEQQIDARRHARERLADDVDEPRRHHGIERAVGERRLQCIRRDQLEPGRARRGRRQPPQHGVILDAARSDRKFVQLDRAPGKQLARREQQQRIEIRGDGQRRIAGAHADRRPAARRRRPAPACDPGRPDSPPSSARSSFRAAWFSSSPHAPVAMQVDVVVSQALLGGQARAQALVRGLGDAGLVEAERREQRWRSRSI